MTEFFNRVQTGATRTGLDILVFSIRLLTGAILGFTLSLVIQELVGIKEGQGLFSAVFVTILFGLSFMRVSRAWTLTATLIFDLVMVLVGLLLRIYITNAP